jgi:hypothetical protein
VPAACHPCTVVFDPKAHPQAGTLAPQARFFRAQGRAPQDPPRGCRRHGQHTRTARAVLEYACLILSRFRGVRPHMYIKGARWLSRRAPSRAAAADGAWTGRQRGVSRALTRPHRLTALARATACCAAAPPRGCCSQRRCDGPLLAEQQRRREGAAMAGASGRVWGVATAVFRFI